MKSLSQFIDGALKEDLGEGDHSSLSSIPESATSVARLEIKQTGVLAGVELAEMIFNQLDDTLTMEILIKDGSAVNPADIGFKVSGKVRSILGAERLVLNCMQRMSGIATLTSQFVEEVRGTKARITDTRKTAPGLRAIDKWAVRLGGGENHRQGLYDMIMLKDNHVDFAGGIRAAIESSRQYLKEKGLELPIEIETRSLDEVKQVMAVGSVDRIMLDNMTPGEIRACLELIDGKLETEASGGIHLENVKDYAETGVDMISVGALTHSVKGLDMSLLAEAD